MAAFSFPFSDALIVKSALFWERRRPRLPTSPLGALSPNLCRRGRLRSQKSVHFVFEGVTEGGRLEAAGAAHRTVVTRFATGFHGASLFTLKEVDKFGDCCFFYTEFFEAGMTNVYASEPRGVHVGRSNLS